MIVEVYSYCGSISRSVVSATLVDTIEVDHWPDDEPAFAREHGGDFLQLGEEP